jgi:high-affinity iron transporter
LSTDAVTSVVAVVLVTWMIFWMRRTARRLTGELHGKLDSAIGVGGLAIAGIAFVSVIREGLETALLFYTAAQGATSTVTPLLAISAGVATSLLLGFGIYAGAIRVNLSKFFTVSGVLLVFVAAGIFKYGIHDFQEAGVVAGLHTLAFDITGVLDPTSWYGAAISGMSGTRPRPSSPALPACAATTTGGAARSSVADPSVAAPVRPAIGAPPAGPAARITPRTEPSGRPVR